MSPILMVSAQSLLSPCFVKPSGSLALAPQMLNTAGCGVPEAFLLIATNASKFGVALASLSSPAGVRVRNRAAVPRPDDRH